MINKPRLVKLTQRLISINSENPGHCEREIAVFLKKYLAGFGIKSKIYEFKKGRSNLVASLKGKTNKHSLLLTPHLDTVPAGRGWRFPAFKGIIRNNRIYGRGASDCKGNLAIAIEAINSLAEDGYKLNYNLIFAATADEEAGSRWGLIPLINKKILRPSSALILDSKEFDIVVTQKGLLHCKVKLQGKKAHGAYPWQGVNAIDLALAIINEIKKYKFTYKPNSLLRPPTVNLGTIRGGDKVNIVSDWCEFELDLRFLPGSSGKDILKTIKNIIKRHAKRFKIEIEAIQRPYCIDKNQRLVKDLLKAARDFSVKAKVTGSEGATTITLFQADSQAKRFKDIPAVAFGCACEGCAHVTDEYITLNNLYRGAKVLERFLKINNMGGS